MCDSILLLDEPKIFDCLIWDKAKMTQNSAFDFPHLFSRAHLEALMWSFWADFWICDGQYSKLVMSGIEMQKSAR